MLLYNTLHLRVSHTYLGISTEKALLKANALIGELSRLRSAPGRRISAHGVVGIMPRCVAEFRGRDLSRVQFYQAVLAHAQSFTADVAAGAASRLIDGQSAVRRWQARAAMHMAV